MVIPRDGVRDGFIDLTDTFLSLNFADMNHLHLFLQAAPNVDEMRRSLDPILRHGRDNISYLYSLDTFDWTIIVLYFTVLLLLAILGMYRIRMVYQFWRYRDIKPSPKRHFLEEELPRITVQLP